MNNLANVNLTKGQQLQVELVNQVDKATQDMGATITEYGRQCVINAIGNLVTYCRTNGVQFGLIDPTMVKIALQNVGFTELNFAATPAEAYFDLRKTVFEDGKGNKVNGYTIAVKPQGAGNEKLTRRFGVNVKELKPAWLIREGDEFTYPSFNGLHMTPPKWTPKSYDKKIIMVCYPLVLKDDSVEYLIATREGIKPNLIAQVRQNNLYTFKKKNSKGYEVTDTEARDKFYDEVNEIFEKLTVDEILADPRWREQLTPTYTSGGSKEAMVLRKMKNNALKNYPREFATDYIAQAVKDMYEDKDESLNIDKKNAIDIDPVEKVEDEIKEEPKPENVVPNFEVNDDGEVVEENVAEEPNPGTSKSDNYDEVL